MFCALTVVTTFVNKVFGFVLFVLVCARRFFFLLKLNEFNSTCLHFVVSYMCWLLKSLALRIKISEVYDIIHNFNLLCFSMFCQI